MTRRVARPALRHSRRFTAYALSAFVGVLAIGCASNQSIIMLPKLRPSSDATAYPPDERSLWSTLLDPCTWSDTASSHRHGFQCSATQSPTGVPIPGRGPAIPPMQPVP